MTSTMSEDAADHRLGGPGFVPSEEQRRTVRVMSGFGIPQPDIASHLGIDPKTLRKHFREELDRGMTEANMRVAQSLFSMATTGNNVAAAIFWMKARAGWREKHEVVVSQEEDTTIMGPEEYREWLARVKARLAELEGPPTITVDPSVGPPDTPPAATSTAQATCSPPTNDR